MKTKKTLLGIILVLLIIIAILLVIQIGSSKEDHSGQGVFLEVNGNDNNPVNAGTALPGVSIPGRTVIELPSGELEADISLHNPETNSDYYDLSYSLIIKETEEIIFDTGLIPPGYKCSHISLNRKLDKGEYDAILFVQPYLKDETHTPVNNAELSILLIVK